MLLCGCVKSEMDLAEKDASLKIRLNAPSFSPELKSVSSAPDSPQEWSTWERAVDGRFLYRVTAFILQGNRLVAHKDLSLQGEPVEAELNFEANFTHGTYTLMIVANYSSFEAEDGANGTKIYDGLSGFASTVQEILSKSTIDNFTQTYADSFLNYQISSENGVCRRVPQPLTLVKEIELHPGTNTISGELIRTYSRVRIAVENSSDEDLRIFSMSFGNVFTQTRSYLFPGLGYPGQKVAIDVASANALTSFTGTEDNPLIIPSKEMSVVFDAYILESIKGISSDIYSYSFGIGYDQTNSFTLASTTSIKNRNGISTGQYLIYSRGSSRFLTSGSTKVTNATLGTLRQGMSIPKAYVWSFENAGRLERFYIGTADALDEGQTSYYISNPSSSSTAALGANKSVYFTAADRNSYLTFQSSGSGDYRYLSSSGNSVGGQNNNRGNSALFELYPVDMPASSEVSVPVKTLNPATGQAEDVEQISRNDFINAIVKVSYSKNQGHFTFEVRDWYTGGGDVDFN